jgi:hypothetical protein
MDWGDCKAAEEALQRPLPSWPVEVPVHNACGVAAIRAQDYRLQQAVEGHEAAFDAAVDEIAAIAGKLLSGLETTAPPKNREEEAAKAKARGEMRFGGR